mgnify:CR=1 FL=1
MGLAQVAEIQGQLEEILRSLGLTTGTVAERLDALGISTTLVMTVKRGVNDDEIGDVIRHSGSWPCVRGVTLQSPTPQALAERWAQVLGLAAPVAQGPGWQLALDEGLVEVCFNREGEAINKLCERTMREFGEVTTLLREQATTGAVRGVLVSSAKDVFIVGADITMRLAKAEGWSEKATRSSLPWTDNKAWRWHRGKRRT